MDNQNVLSVDKPIIVDATDHIAGRLSSNVAKLLLNGNRVSIVNCEKIMLSGTRTNIISKYRGFLEVKSVIHPRHGPIHPRRPDTIMKRMIRGMLPQKKSSGMSAHKRLRTYIGSPKELSSFEKVQFKEAKIRKSPANYTTVGDVAKIIGWIE